jgi:outer membrane protein assembly factor BamB
MKIDISKSKITTIAFVLLLTTSAMLVALPSVYAQTKATISYLGVMPNPVGVNQQVLMHVGMMDSLSDVSKGWEGMTISVEDPEGITSTIEVPKTDSTGGTGISWTPTKVGTYTLQAHFPQQEVTVSPFFWGSPYNQTYLASNSEIVYLEVLDEDIQYYPGHSLPSNYWTRPIDAQLREWYSIAGSWTDLPRNNYAPYNDYAPDTAHILWTKELTSGGLVGGNLGGYSFEIGDAYEGKFDGSAGVTFDSRSIIVAGNLYYQESTQENPVITHCVDLHTGEEQWAKVFLNNQTISFGQLFYWDGFNMHGCFAYLWVASGSGYEVFDAYSGDWLFTVTNVPSGTMIFDELNHMYKVRISGGRMTLWNMTAVVMAGTTASSMGSWGSRAHGQTWDASDPDAITVNVTIPSGLPGSIIAANFGDMVVGGTATGTESISLWGLNLNTSVGEIGEELFSNTWEAFDYWTDLNLTLGLFGTNWVGTSFEDRVIVLWAKETRQHFAFSLETGDFLWGPDSPDVGNQYYLDALDDTPATARAIAYGKFYSASVSGVVYCYDIQNGTLLWETPIDDPYSEFLFANTWWVKPTFVTDGKIYMGHLEHSPVDPRPRGGPFVCLNATDGEVIWRADGLFRQTRWGGRAVIGDSIMATMDTYDQRVYAVGKGQSVTTLTVAPKTVAVGKPILLEGTVMDASPGTEQTDVQLRFPSGVAAVSDESMSDWMLYIYKQFEVPADVTGVEVVFNWVDADGEWHDMVRTTTDMSGSYSIAWTPDTEGTVTIVATFHGSGGYFASYAETAIVVGPAEGYQGPSASEIAQETVNQMPAYPNVPTADEVAQATVSQMPAYPTVPSASEVAQETANQMPAYFTIDLVVMVLVIIAIILGLYAIIKKK